MDEVSAKLTILFEDPFWIGLYERVYKKKLEVCKITFGKGPSDSEVYEFMLKNWRRLRFSPPVAGIKPQKEKINPKRMQREIHKSQKNTGIGTKSQQALKLQQEQMKDTKKAAKKLRKEEESKRSFELKQQKKKEKHRGH